MKTNLLDLAEDEVATLREGPRWAVDLHMQFDEGEAPTPVDAVSQFLVAILYRDMREMTFTVRDRHSDSEDPTVYVHEGRVYSRVDFDTKPVVSSEEGERPSPRRGNKKPLT